MRLAFFILLIATKATQMASAAQAIIKAQNKDTSARALRGENSEDDGVNSFIIGGETLNQTIWEESRRYLVSIRSNSDGGHRCGATKISDRVVLTAAHCFSVSGSNDWRARKSIQFNRYSQDDENKTGVIPVDLCQKELRTGCDGEIDGHAYVVRHPNWNRPTFENDIALIFLPEDRKQEIANIPDATLNCNPNVPVDDQELEAFGWGCVDENDCDTEPKLIQTGMLEYLTNQECNTLCLADEECLDFLEKGITDDMLCANTNSTRGVAVGSGDSGGPLVIGDTLQVGVVSYGSAGGEDGTTTFPESPDGFARVSFFCDWIRNTVCAEIPNEPVFCQATSQPTSQPTSKPTSQPTSQPSQSKASKQTKQAKASN